MKLEDQVCTLKQAKRLQQLGVLQKSLWYWETLKETGVGFVATERITASFNTGHPISNAVVEASFSAFTVAELGMMMQAYIQTGHSFYNIQNNLWAHTWSKNFKIQPIIGWYDSEAKARATMLILLLEEKLVTIEEVNQRLTA